MQRPCTALQRLPLCPVLPSCLSFPICWFIQPLQPSSPGVLVLSCLSHSPTASLKCPGPLFAMPCPTVGSSEQPWCSSCIFNTGTFGSAGRVNAMVSHKPMSLLCNAQQCRMSPSSPSDPLLLYNPPVSIGEIGLSPPKSASKLAMLRTHLT